MMGALLLYSGLLCAVSVSVFVAAWRQGSPLKIDDILMQTLMTVFLPILVLGIWKQRIASGLLFVGTGVDIILLLTLGSRTGDGMATMIVGSIAFVGVPMLAAAIFLTRRAPRRAASPMIPS